MSKVVCTVKLQGFRCKFIESEQELYTFKEKNKSTLGYFYRNRVLSILYRV